MLALYHAHYHLCTLSISQGGRVKVILKVGTHSRRKFAADYAANCGNSSEEVEIRARWKRLRSGKIVFIYITYEKAYEDAKVAGTLCIGGPIMYKLKDGLDEKITQQWIFEKVIPNIRQRYRDLRLCNVLGKALLYACMSDEEGVIVPDDIRNRVRREYELLDLDEAQPVEKVPLHIQRIEDKLQIDPISERDMVEGLNIGTASGNKAIQNAIQTLTIRQTQDRNENNRLHNATFSAIQEMRNDMHRHFKVTNNNVRCFGGTIEGAFVRQRTQQTSDRAYHLQSTSQGLANHHVLEAVVRPAILSHNPKSCLMLWKEYKEGLNGMKAAEQFTPDERNVSKKVATMYGRRNYIWQAIQRMVNAGYSATYAIQKIHAAYGADASVTKIIECMKEDKNRYPGGIHPTLM